jgi:hypothetical protein
MRGRGCQAQDRESFKESGWLCTGSALTVLIQGPDGLPCVLPDPMVPAALAQPWGRAYGPPVPFAGGDHYHLVAPDSWLHA